MTDGGKIPGTLSPPASGYGTDHQSTRQSSSLNYGLQEVRKGEPLAMTLPALPPSACVNHHSTLTDPKPHSRNFQKSPHQTRSHPPQALSKKAAEKSAGETLCYLDQALRRRHLDHRQQGAQRTGSPYAIMLTRTFPPLPLILSFAFVTPNGQPYGSKCKDCKQTTTQNGAKYCHGTLTYET